MTENVFGSGNFAFVKSLMRYYVLLGKAGWRAWGVRDLKALWIASTYSISMGLEEYRNDHSHRRLGENIHEQTNKVVAGIYPEGMHTTIAKALNTDAGIEATTATLQEPEHGLSEARLEGHRRSRLVGP